jgi:outer membrane protein TolC
MNITDRRNKGIPVYTAGLGISYDLDLFGANRASETAAQERFVGSAYRHDALALVIMGDVAQNYFNVLNLKERVRLAQDSLRATQDLRKVVEARFQTGVRTQLDLTRQETLVAKAKASLAALEQELAIAQNALAVLVGVPPQSFTVTGKTIDKLTLPEESIIQPAFLLERRPDIKAMEAMLKAANASIGEARAAFYPSLTLAASILAPIFQGGKLEGNLERITAHERELIAQYQQTVLVAFQEAENALTKTQKTFERENALKQAVAKANQTYKLTQNQYGLSVIEFQDVLNAQRNLLDTKDQYARARYETLAARVDLFKAMGGGWLTRGEPHFKAQIEKKE